MDRIEQSLRVALKGPSRNEPGMRGTAARDATLPEMCSFIR